MRVALSLIAVLFTALLSAPALGVSVEDVPNPRHSNVWVSDTIDVLDSASELLINTQLDKLERDTTVEIAVVTVQEVDTATPKGFATELFNHWGIGKADSDNGLLILLVRGERRLEMETGYGTEVVLHDAWLKRMQTREMVPHFKAGRYGEGLKAGITTTIDKLRDDGTGNTGEAHRAPGTSFPSSPAGIPAGKGRGTPMPSPGNDDGPPWWMLLFGASAVGVTGGGLIYKHKKDRTCPECNVRMKMLSESADDEHLTKGQQTEEFIDSVDYQFFYCARCEFDRMLTDRKWFSGFSKCPSCANKTLSTESQTLRRATTSSTGQKEVTTECIHCDYHHTHHITLPRVTRSSSSSGGGFSGGGGGGSSFGGGSSGGGGAGSSW
jgi:uncharacterized protein